LTAVAKIRVVQESAAVRRDIHGHREDGVVEGISKTFDGPPAFYDEGTMCLEIFSWA
jgi:hypothetical protein